MVWVMELATGIAWLGTIYHFRILLRRGRSVLVVYYWLALLFISLALTFAIPPVYVIVNTLADIPRLSKLLTNVCAVLAVLSAQNAVFLSLVSESNVFRLRLSSFANASLALLVMIVLFFTSGPLPDAPDFRKDYAIGTFAAYRFAYLTYMALSAVLVTYLWLKYTLASESVLIKLSFGLMASGGLVGLIHLLNDAGAVLAGLRLHALPWWSDLGVNYLLIGLAITFVMAGGMMPVWSRAMQALRSYVTYFRLRPLWLELCRACPSVVPPIEDSIWRDALSLRNANFRLHRQVIEIRDASSAVSRFANPYTLRLIREIAESMKLEPVESAALVEAVWLRTTLDALKSVDELPLRLTESRSEVSIQYPNNVSFREEVNHLIRVTRHMEGSPQIRTAFDALGYPTESNSRGGPDSSIISREFRH